LKQIYIADSAETQVDIRYDPMRLVMDRSRPCLVAATRTVIAIPFSGDPVHPGRFEGFQFDAAVQTNLTQDHLNYHKSMDDYFAATLLLTNERLKINRTAIIHTDDEYAFGPSRFCL
jgi:UDP-N-acetylmuramoyl-L-alanyl-D-glutamate--2,6-diaminopimelate ligase